MAAKLIMCRGLPGCGKSTWAAAQAGAVVVNKDTIRAQFGMDGLNWNKGNENLVLEERDKRIAGALRLGQDVISDDTNFARIHKVRLAQIAEEFGAKFEIKDFKDVPLEECIRRDSLRVGKAKVGEQVIMKMYNQYLKPQEVVVQKYVPTKTNLPKAIICDLDGTLSLFDGKRGPYDASKCAADDINHSVLAVLWSMFALGYQVIFLSGREEVYKPQTLEFLTRCGMAQRPLFMRAKGDFRKDWIVKNELFLANIADKYDVIFILDDRDQVVKMWRDMGLTCFQVNYGNF